MFEAQGPPSAKALSEELYNPAGLGSNLEFPSSCLCELGKVK